MAKSVCGSPCARFDKKPDDRMSAHGCGRCKEMPEGRYVSDVAPCQFVPSRFVARVAP